MCRDSTKPDVAMVTPFYETSSQECSRQATVTSVWGEPWREKAVILAEEQSEREIVKEELGMSIVCVRIGTCVIASCMITVLLILPGDVYYNMCQLSHAIRFPLPPFLSLIHPPLTSSLGNDTVIPCDVLVDTIQRIEIVTRTRELEEEVPEMFHVRAFDEEGRHLCISQADACTAMHSQIVHC